MAKSINMPQVGQDVETAIITEWCVKENDTVEKGDIIAVVDSDKASFEVETFESGTILKLLYKEGEIAHVFKPIAIIGEPGEIIEDNMPLAEKKAQSIREGSASRIKDKVPGVSSGNRILATPAVKRVAREHHINLADVNGSGPNGRILKEDLLAFIENASHGPGESITGKMDRPEKTIDSGRTKDTEKNRDAGKTVDAAGTKTDTGTTGDSGITGDIGTTRDSGTITESGETSDDGYHVKYTKMRQAIADRMLESKQHIPHFYLITDVDVTDLLIWRKAHNKDKNKADRITVNDLLVLAVAKSLRKHPQLNAHVSQTGMSQKKDIHLGIAVSVDGGLIVPVLEKADEKDVHTISRECRDLIEGAQQGKLKATAPGTFTISNLGMYAIDAFVPIINPPEAAILGIGKSEKKVLPLATGDLGVRDILTLTLACDHRAVDGTIGAQFLEELKNNLEKLKYIDQ
jgi:pyruvate dehydrogenase E2 component (dihydrolipoamide acetyltransferase)